MKIAVAAALVVVAACSDRKSQPPAAALPPARSSPPAKPSASTVIPKTTKQLVTAVVDDWVTTKATLRLWERTTGDWQAFGEPWPGVIGRSGSAWGIGLHGVGAPNREGPLKKEGDGKSPAGAFSLVAAYGTAEEPPAGTKLPYESTARGDYECIDDPGSEHYARIVDRKQVASDWESSELLMSDGGAYTWVVDVAHNPEHTPGKGSCIFLHVWGGKDSSTDGCTAMEDKQLASVIARLDPSLGPVFVLLPRADYIALSPSWGLPAL